MDLVLEQRTDDDGMVNDPSLNGGGGGKGEVGSTMIAPPPLDPLDGLEVIVGGTYTVGTLRQVSTRAPRSSSVPNAQPEPQPE
eukprot:10833355-Ditylum_brightwellii.AAC.1